MLPLPFLHAAPRWQQCVTLELLRFLSALCLVRVLLAILWLPHSRLRSGVSSPCIKKTFNLSSSGSDLIGVYLGAGSHDRLFWLLSSHWHPECLPTLLEITTWWSRPTIHSQHVQMEFIFLTDSIPYFSLKPLFLYIIKNIPHPSKSWWSHP